MIYIVAIIFFALGAWFGYRRSHAIFGAMCDDGQLIWRWEENDGECGWEGEPEAMKELKGQLWLKSK